MQWDKVKNILLVILLLVDGFLGWSVASRYVDARAQEKAFAENLSTVLARSGVEYSAERTVPTQRIMPLETSRSRTAEEQMARAVLTGELHTEVAQTGALSFVGDNGSMVWQADGTLKATFRTQEPVPAGARQMEHRARQLLQTCGVSLRGGTLTADTAARAVTLTATVDGKPVFNRSLTVTFAGNGGVGIAGQWSFPVPYASAGEEERVCNVADALLDFTEQDGGVRRIDGAVLGYRLNAPLGVSGRLQLTPTWRIETDEGVKFIDALK